MALIALDSFVVSVNLRPGKSNGDSLILESAAHLGVEQLGVPPEDLRDRTGHRAVEKDHQVRDGAFPQKLADDSREAPATAPGRSSAR